jgi:hypothetical protein
MIEPFNAPPLPEPERLKRLWAQVGERALPPASLRAVVSGERLEPWKVQEALAICEASRAEVRQTGSYEAAERLLFLTMLLADHLGELNARQKQRELLESALGVFTLERHRRLVRGCLCREAVRDGDVVAAERWLVPCDSHSDNLQEDSSYRVARAFLDTARGNWHGVLQVLGPNSPDVPMQDALRATAAVLRANALERLGDLQAASASLQYYMQSAGVLGRTAVEGAIQRSPTPKLCPISSKVRRTPSRAGSTWFWGGVTCLVLSAVGSLVVVALGASGVLEWGALRVATPLVLPALLLGAISAVLGYFPREAERLRATGVRAVGRVTAIQQIAPFSKAAQARIRVRIELMVELPGNAPYQACVKAFIESFNRPKLQPGALLLLRGDPQDPQQLVIETD